MADNPRDRLLALAGRDEKLPDRLAIDYPTSLIQACGGRLYKLLLETAASQVKLADGMDAQTHITALERAISANTTTRFADNIAQRNALEGLISGDRCYVADATADPSVAAGGAMYLWSPGTRWTKLWNGQNPVDLAAHIDGLSIRLDEFGRLKTDFNAMPEGTLASLMAELPPEQIAAILALALGRGLHLEEGRIAARLSDAVDLEDGESAASSLAVAKVGAKVASNEAGLQDLNRKMSAALPAIESAEDAAQTAGEAAASALAKAQEALQRAADVAKMEGPAGRDGVDGAPGRDGVDGAAAGFGTPAVSVDANVGVPSCSISATGPDSAKVFSFEFKNLKGEPGRDGADGSPGRDGVDGKDGAPGRDGTEAPLVTAENDGLMAAADKAKLDNDVATKAYLAANHRRRLTANETIYVATAGSDELTAGRGESAETPFKTIQAAVDYARANIDLGNFDLTIKCAKSSMGGDVYDDIVHFYEIPNGGGNLILEARDGKVKKIVNHSCGNLQLNMVNFVFGDVDTEFLAEPGTSTTLYRCSFSGKKNADALDPHIAITNKGGVVRLAYLCELWYDFSDVIFCEAGASLFFTSSFTLNYATTFNVFLKASTCSSVFLEDGCSFDNRATGGQKYVASGNAVINSGGLGADFLPGREAGVCETGGQYI